MKRRSSVKSIGFILITAILVMGFGVQEAPAAKSAWKWPSTLTIVTTGAGTGTFASCNGIAVVMAKTTGMKVRVLPEGTSAVRFEKLYKKQANVSSESSSSWEDSITGNSGFASRELHGQRLFWLHYDTPWGYVVRADSPYKTIYDLKKVKGIRISVNTSIPSFVNAVKNGIPAFLGMSEAEANEHFVWVPCGSVAANVLSVAEGKVDVGYGASTSSGTIEAEAGPHGIRYLEMPPGDKEAWKRFQATPGGSTRMPSAITYGAKSLIGANSYISFFFFNVLAETDAADEELVYQLTKWFHKNYDAYKSVHANASRASLENFRKFLDGNSLPVANGCIRYLREIGKWTSQDDKRQEESLKLEKRWFDARRAINAEAGAKKIKISYNDAEFMKIYEAHTKDLPFFVMTPPEK
jgi:TRAP transporter TAXI family solute receptor